MSTEDIHEEPYESEEKREWRFTVWHSIGLMLLLGILQAWTYLVLSKMGSVEFKDMSWFHMALISGVPGVATAWAGAMLTNFSIPGALTAGRIEASEALSALITILGVIILSSELNNLFQWLVPMNEEIDLPGKFMSENLAGVIFTVGVVAPVTEELIFRGVILEGLRKNYRLQIAILVSSLLFALVHVQPYLMINAFLLGLLFSLIRLRTGSLVLCMLVHGFYNVLPFLLTRVFPVEIVGFTQLEKGSVVFQPLWFDAIGIALTVLGLAGLRMSREESHDPSKNLNTP